MGRKVNKKGRSEGAARHVRLHHAVMKTPAWKSLGPQSRVVLIELYALYNGQNNGDFFLSCREAAERCNISRNTAKRCFDELQDKGFIRSRAREPTGWEEKKARCWILTEYTFFGAAPTRDYLQWRPPEKTESVALICDRVSQKGATSPPDEAQIIPIKCKSGSHLGQKRNLGGSHLGHR